MSQVFLMTIGVTVKCPIQLSTNQIAMYSRETMPLARDFVRVANHRTAELSQWTPLMTWQSLMHNASLYGNVS